VKTLIRSLVLALSIGLVGWSIAQPPAEPEEPPVRLKKKKKTTPEKPESPPEKPEPLPEPKKKPKLDEDADLDPRDDIRMPQGEEPEEDEIIRRIIRNTRLSEEKLANRETGEATRKLQDEVIRDIDRLLEQQKQNQQNPQDQKNDNPSGGMGQDQNQQRSAQEREERRKRRMSGQQTASRNQGGQQQGQGGAKSGQGQGNGNTPGGGGTGAKGDPRDPEKKFDLWGHLPEKERALMNKEMEQRFMEKYDDLTKQYYRTIAEKSRPRK
jgi:hypothetical protein